MEHVVFFPAHDGSPAFRRVSSLEDAVRLVEHLRNVENVAELSVHALTEVPLAFKAFYRVEVPGEAPAAEVAAAEAPAVEAPAVEAPVAEVPSQEMPPPLPVEVPAVVADAPPVEASAEEMVVPALAASSASSNGHSEDAPSSLGFFAS